MPEPSGSTGLQSVLPIADLFTAEYLEYYRILPLELTPAVVRVAVAGEPAREVIEDLELTYGLPVETVATTADDLRDALRRAFASAESVVELVEDLRAEMDAVVDPGDDAAADIRDLVHQPPVIRFVNLLIREAHDTTASDIHLEATRDGLRVRLRIDGVLTDLPAPPRGLQAAVVSRIKLIAELDIAERRLPQDGRVRVRLESRELDLRVSTVPTLFGESVVIRLLDRGGRAVTLEELGMPALVLRDFRRLAERPHGIVLATGPTGSGKTTTLYAALALRNAGREKVITVEDPVEYHLPNVTQVPVHTKAGVTFAAALRSILRQDPDVLMVGEMRDGETAAIAVQAAMTGHLVFSTVHTNDAVGALTRLADLGIEPYLIAATVEGILAQRLVRRICSECRESYRVDADVVALVAGAPVSATPARLQRGRGCATCRQTGFRGRTGIYELLLMTDPLRDRLLRNAGITELRDVARDQGLVSMRADGWQKVQAGITTIDEVLRVAQD